jgi:futalosine hydrolase
MSRRRLGLRVDLVELRSLVRDVDLVLLTATRLEAKPFLASLKAYESLEMAGIHTWRGSLGPEPRATPVALVVGGYDKVNASHALTCLLLAARPALVLQVGVAGAYPGSGLAVGDLALATEEVYADTGVLAPEGWLSTEAIGLALARVGGREYGNAFPLDPGLVRAALRVVEEAAWREPRPLIAAGRCLTSSLVTGRAADAGALAGRWHALAESMEGAAAAHVCALHGVPFLEVRGISNLAGDRDKAGWDLNGAAARAAAAALAICARLDDVLAAAADTFGHEA